MFSSTTSPSPSRNIPQPISPSRAIIFQQHSPISPSRAIIFQQHPPAHLAQQRHYHRQVARIAAAQGDAFDLANCENDRSSQRMPADIRYQGGRRFLRFPWRRAAKGEGQDPFAARMPAFLHHRSCIIVQLRKGKDRISTSCDFPNC